MLIAHKYALPPASDSYDVKTQAKTAKMRKQKCSARSRRINTKIVLPGPEKSHNDFLEQSDIASERSKQASEKWHIVSAVPTVETLHDKKQLTPAELDADRVAELVAE